MGTGRKEQVLTDELGTILDDEYVDYMRMWSKRYLQRVRSCVHTIAMIRSEIAEIESMADGIGAVRYDRDKVTQTPDDEGLLRRIERMELLKSELDGELDQNLQWQADAHRALRNVRQPWRAVLTYRYLEGKPWADVAYAVGYSEVHCRTELHDNGLVELYPYVPHEYDELPSAI